MKSRAVKIFLCIIFFLGLTPIGSAENLPNEMFRIGKIELGKTTFGEIEKNHGNAKSFRTSKDDGADEYICYIQKHGKSKQYIVFAAVCNDRGSARKRRFFGSQYFR